MNPWDPTPETLERAVTSTHRMRTSTRPQWRDAKQRLADLGIGVHDAILTEWEPSGEHLMCGIIVTRDERVFNFCVVYDYDENGEPLEKGEGWITLWKEIPSEDVGLMPSGIPNSWAYAIEISRLVIEAERQGPDTYPRAEKLDVASAGGAERAPDPEPGRSAVVERPVARSDTALRCLTCKAVDHSGLEGEFWPPASRQPANEWTCSKCGGREYAESVVTVDEDGRVFDEAGKRIAVELVEGRVYLVARPPHPIQALLRYAGRSEDLLHWTYKGAPSREISLSFADIEWIDV